MKLVRYQRTSNNKKILIIIDDPVLFDYYYLSSLNRYCDIHDNL